MEASFCLADAVVIGSRSVSGSVGGRACSLFIVRAICWWSLLFKLLPTRPVLIFRSEDKWKAVPGQVLATRIISTFASLQSMDHLDITQPCLSSPSVNADAFNLNFHKVVSQMMSSSHNFCRWLLDDAQIPDNKSLNVHNTRSPPVWSERRWSGSSDSGHSKQWDSGSNSE